MKTIFTCSACKYTFAHEGECEQCPDCGKYKVRLATDKEKADFNRYQQEFKKDEK